MLVELTKTGVPHRNKKGTHLYKRFMNLSVINHVPYSRGPGRNRLLSLCFSIWYDVYLPPFVLPPVPLSTPFYLSPRLDGPLSVPRVPLHNRRLLRSYGYHRFLTNSCPYG